MSPINDERFDRELRAALERLAAKPAPDGLRAAVRAIPGAHPAGRPGARSWQGLRVLAALAATAIVVAVASFVLASQPRSLPGPTPRASSTAAAIGAAPSPSPPPATPTPTPVAVASAPPIAAFTTPPEPAVTAAWSGIRWTRLASSDPLARVRSMVTWRGGYVALGGLLDSGPTSRTPVWTSSDGSHWQPLDASALGTSTIIEGMLPTGRGLVALTVRAATNACAPTGDCWSFAGPLRSWTSSDGTSWTAHAGPVLSSVSSVLATGPGGLVAMDASVGSTGPSRTRVAISPDGVTWRTLELATIPAGITIADLRGTAHGYFAVGAQATTPELHQAVALWSTDGQRWRIVGPLALASTGGLVLASTGTSWSAGTILAARNGFLAIGGTDAATPGGDFWWQSADGRSWRALTNFPPLGATTCQGEGCGGQPEGTIAADGQRMVALRGVGPGDVAAPAAAWTSVDGRTWKLLALSGTGPSDATDLEVLPMGILASDGAGTWFGAAVAP